MFSGEKEDGDEVGGEEDVKREEVRFCCCREVRSFHSPQCGLSVVVQKYRNLVVLSGTFGLVEIQASKEEAEVLGHRRVLHESVVRHPAPPSIDFVPTQRK